MTDSLGVAVVTTADDGPIPTPGGPLSYIHWGPIIAGAIAAAAVSFVLNGFAASVGLAVASPSPTWRDTSAGLTVLSGVWILVTTVGAFALGGYLAGRVRSSWSTTPDEVEFRDGTHGLLVWALGVMIGAALLWGTASAFTAASMSGAQSARTQTSEPAFLAYELDRLFRSERRAEPADPEIRGEAGRILLTGIGRRDILANDRAALVRMVAARTNLAPPEADQRVTQVIEQARQANRQARISAIILGFSIAASLAAGAVAAWLAAGIGGKHRDQAISPPLRWSWRRA